MFVLFLIPLFPSVSLRFVISINFLFFLQQIATPSTHYCHLSCTPSRNQLLDLYIAGGISEGAEAGCHDPMDSLSMCYKQSRAAQLQ